MSHKAADCLERPRAKGARWTNKNIAADDKVQEIALVGFDSKRDRYNGYDTAEYGRVVERYEAVEALRQEAKAREQVEQLYAAGRAQEAADAAAAAAGDGGGGGDDAKIADEEDAGEGRVWRGVAVVRRSSSSSQAAV